jgi:hypothetical protein
LASLGRTVWTMSDTETHAVVVNWEGTPVCTVVLRDVAFSDVMATIGRSIGWRHMEERVTQALRKLAPDGFERRKGLAVPADCDAVIHVDMTERKDIIIACLGESAVYEKPEHYPNC